MRRIGICAMVALGLVLAGCVPGPGPTRAPVVTVEPEVPQILPMPIPPRYIQMAIDAVGRYWEVWTRIAKNLDTADWNDIRSVADSPVVEAAFDQWEQWRSRGVYFVGWPGFEVDLVDPSVSSPEGSWYVVYLCHLANNSYLADDSGDPVEGFGFDRIPVHYLVIRSPDGRFAVVAESVKDGTC